MIKLERILCPTDLSIGSDEALRYAVALASAYGAKLFLLHCSETSPSAAEENHFRTQTQMAPQFAASLAPYVGLPGSDGLKWTGLVRNNVYHTGKVIVQEAAAQKIDLIVMRSRRRPRAAVLLGSTAETVCREAPCAVLVTHPLEREWVGVGGKINLRRILIAHDFSQDSQKAMRYGLALAQEYQADLHLLHVLATAGSEEPELAWSASGSGNAYTLTAQKLQQAVAPEVSLWCRFINVVRCGKVYEEILIYAAENDIDLICMGVSGNDWTIGKLLGSNVDRVLRHAPCPVLVAGSRDQRNFFERN